MIDERRSPSVVELFAGAGGMSQGLELAGFDHRLLIDIDQDAVATLLANRPNWDVRRADIRSLTPPTDLGLVDLLVADMPSVGFSEAGLRESSTKDELFDAVADTVSRLRPRALLLQNVRALSFKSLRTKLTAQVDQLSKLGYSVDSRLMYASQFGVAQLRPRFMTVAFRADSFSTFQWPRATETVPSVGELLLPFMTEREWVGANRWAENARTIAPTLIGGSRLHGGADLGPTRAKQAWLMLGVDPRGIASDPPPANAPAGFLPKLTIEMIAALQDFEPGWQIAGRKTSAYRQVASATPPAVARAVALAIRDALTPQL